VRHDNDNEYHHRLRRVVQLADASPGELRAVACAAEWLDVPRGRDLGRAGVYLVVSGSVTTTSAGRTTRVEAGDAFVAGDAPVRAVACTDATVVTIGPREWRAMHVLAPGVVAKVGPCTAATAGQNIRAWGRTVARGADESRAAVRIVCMYR
jgi:hypothetical protein